MDEGSFCRRSNVFGADLIVIFPSWVLRSPCMIGEIALQSRSQMMFEPVWVTWYSTPLFRAMCACRRHPVMVCRRLFMRSEEHTSELQSLMRISYAVFCLKKKKTLICDIYD